MIAQEPRVAAVVVSYNVRELLLECLASLATALEEGELASVVVVDCQSSDGSSAAVRAQYPWVSVIDAPNRGFGSGANVGIAASCSRCVLVLNADTRVPPGTIGSLAGYLDAHPWTAIVAPRLRYPDGREQPSRRRFPRRLTPLFESTLLHQRWPANPWAREFLMADCPAGDEADEVDWVVGAALLVRRAAIERAGGFDESFRMYSEEVEWCWRLRRHGWRIAWLPSAEVIHHEGASTGQDIPTRQVDFDTSRVRLARLLYGRAAGDVVRAGLLAGYATQLAIESAKWAVGHRRGLRAARVRLYARALAGRLRIDGAA